MVDVPDSLRVVFAATLDERDGDYVVEIPSEEVANGVLSAGETYRVAVLDDGRSGANDDTAGSEEPTDRSVARSGSETPRGGGTSSTGRSGSSRSEPPTPPVDEGEVREVTIESLGDQGDGIAKVDRGYVVIVPDSEPGDQPTVEIERVRPNVAFASVVEANVDAR